ncbi:MAG: AbrB/MazE/SpoVT family DNA-binding domain-containing protein [Gammaproteobacteria bacterium]|nr:AbrB/MazE/SpoVT family DNA-binding domain-containing protein [Gammaproteobacteria bacterium]MDE0479266.1 AbrB/MazE/SpoVT family DNA-binding domain-containing protein [Gammaproteobacteria bacterium]MXX05942.1 AbrB/MazE/SpoVT family DNA-binding domain-containing protein [Gammaproteobacteria bacterium]MYA35844.1 AbrB/MazE/SpoVT family DNA-binding domain-containing protein [Gammaproteobacteria bacterium]MYE29430.1 AbrB/MazE/SpoVT family DNA-binding domain-containing protein [Gammaproteobacteria 
MDKVGRLVMPSDLRKALNLDGEQELLVSLEDGCVRLRTIDEGLSRVREIAKRRRKKQGSMVDEFIAERRAESLRD